MILHDFIDLLSVKFVHWHTCPKCMRVYILSHRQSHSAYIDLVTLSALTKPAQQFGHAIIAMQIFRSMFIKTAKTVNF